MQGREEVQGKTIGRLSLAGIAIASLALTAGYVTNGLWLLAPATVILGGVWALGQRQGRAAASATGLALAVLAAAVGLWLGVGAGWALAGVVAALSAWDLGQFEQHLRQSGQVQGRQELERRHLLRLALADAVGLLLGIVALHVQVRFSLFAALLLAALLALGVGELIVYLRQGHQE